MSRVYFHAEDGTAELAGPERAYAGGVCNDLFVSAIGLRGFLRPDDIAGYLTLFPADHYLHRMDLASPTARKSIETAMAVDDQFFLPALNTANVMGSDPVRLLARLHGQCEIHGYVEGRHRAWLAALIDHGRASKVLRAGMGWEGVSALLMATDSGPVVMSYSVTDTFPGPHIAGNWSGDDEAWYELPRSKQWAHAIDGLYTSDDGLQIDPDAWDDFFYGDGTTAFDLLESIRRPSQETP